MSLNSGPKIGLCREISPPLPGKTVPAFSRHYSCENTPRTRHPAHGLASLLLAPLADSRYAGFPLPQPSPVPGFTAVTFCFDAFGR